MSTSLTAPAPPAPSGLIQSLQRGLKVFEFVCRSAQPVVAKQVAAELDLNLSTAYHLLNTLEFEGFVQRSDDRTFVAAAGGLARLQGQALSISAERLKAQRTIGRAAFAVEGMSTLSSLDGVEAVIREVGEVPGVDTPDDVRRGRRHLAHSSVVGRAALASATRCQEVDPAAILNELSAACQERGEPIHRPATERSISALLNGSPAVETSNGFLWVAVPVTCRSSFPCAVGVGRPARGVRPGNRQELAALLKTARATATCLATTIGPGTFRDEV